MEETDNRVVVFIEHGMEKPRENLRVDTGAGNGRADTDDHHDAKREDDALAQFRNLKTVGECRKHGAGG